MHAELSVKLTPRSSRSKLEPQPDGSLRAWVTAAPTDGQANEALCELVADKLGIAKSRVEVVRGHTSRSKVLLVEGLSRADVESRIAPP